MQRLVLKTNSACLISNWQHQRWYGTVDRFFISETYSEVFQTEIAWCRFLWNRTVVSISAGSRASTVRIQLNCGRFSWLQRLKEVSLLPAGDRFLHSFKLWCICLHVPRSSHVGNEICNLQTRYAVWIDVREFMVSFAKSWRQLSAAERSRLCEGNCVFDSISHIILKWS
jgi:hypothetical protein